MEKLVVIKWVSFWKKSMRNSVKPCATKVFPITEKNKWLLDDEKTLLGEAESWATLVDTVGLGTGFEYGFELLDKPPVEWIEERRKSLPKEIENKTALLELLNTY